jgi:hypothetical protein
MEGTPADSNAGLVFQKCGACGQQWKEWSAFILDPLVRLLGFQAIVSLPDANLMIFEHSCGSSISVLVKRLRHLLPAGEGETALANLYGSPECNGHCRFLGDLEACDRRCSNARDRQLILMFLEMKRNAG